MSKSINEVLEIVGTLQDALEEILEEPAPSGDGSPPATQPKKVYSVGLRSAYPKERTYKGLLWEDEWREQGLLYDSLGVANRAKNNALRYLHAFALAVKIAEEARTGFHPDYIGEDGYPVYVPFFRFNNENVEIVVKERTSTFAPFAFVFPTEESARKFGETLLKEIGY
jgi:hypothetical protein